MLEIIAPDFNPPLPSEPLATLKSKLTESLRGPGTLYISPGSMHPHIAALVWTSGGEAAHTVESVELLRTAEGAAHAAEHLLDIWGRGTRSPLLPSADGPH